MKAVTAAGILSLMAVAWSAPAGAQDSAQRSMTPVGDGEGLFRVDAGARFPNFFPVLVTGEGVLVVDPPNPETAAWLQDEIERRFPGREVRYVVESHHHWDHTRGAANFTDTATFIGHENLPAELYGTIGEAPPPGNTRDSDGDNLLQRSEAMTGTLASFDTLDDNGDGVLTQAELTAPVAPDIVFSERLEIELGGQHAVLIWTGGRHADSQLDVFFPDHGVLFGTDYMQFNRLCCQFNFDDKPLDIWIESFRRLEALDFDTVFATHGDTGTKQDLVAARRWLEDLRRFVADGIGDGLTLEQLQEAAPQALQQYSDWSGFGDLDAFVASAHANLTAE